MPTKRVRQSWPELIGTFLAVAAFAGALVSAYVGIVQRLTLLEAEQQFSHGDVRPYLAKD